jgi:HEAT repeat protein
MMQDNTSLRTKLKALRKGEIPSEELYGLIHDFGHAMFLDAEPDVVALLNHSNDLIRSIAVRVLTFHWDNNRHRDELIRVLQHDPDKEVRSFSAAGLGFVFRDSHDPVVSRALIKKVRDNKEVLLVRDAAYGALRHVWSPPNVDQEIADIREEIRRAKVEEKDLDTARSHEEFLSKLSMWNQGRLLKIDWGFVERVEREIQRESSGSSPPPSPR